MYCNCVPVTFHIEGSGVNWVSQNGVTGEEVPLYDVKAYAHAVDKILTDDELKNRYIGNARKRVVENFTDTISVETANRLFKKLLGL